jgi:peroxiredoxin
MRGTLNSFAIVGLLLLGAACASNESASRSEPDGPAADAGAPPARGAASGTSILDVVPPPADAGGYSDPTKREFVKGSYRYTRDWYEKRRRSEDASGRPLPMAEQFAFTVSAPNVASSRYTLDGVTSGAAVEAGPGSEMALIGADGKPTSLGAYRGKPLVVVFTRGFPGYICPMCVCYTAQFAAAYEEIKRRGAELVIVFPGPRERLASFVTACREAVDENNVNYQLPFPVCMDADLELVERFGIKADLSRPATYVFDAEGNAEFCFNGDDPSQRPSIPCILNKLDAMSGSEAGSRR